MPFSLVILIGGLAMLLSAKKKPDSQSWRILGVFLSSAGFTSLMIYLVGGGAMFSFIVMISIFVLIAGVWIIYSSLAKKNHLRNKDD